MDHSQIEILLVDDEPAVCSSLVGFLEDYDFSVDSAFTAEDALRMLEVKVYDVLIVDLRLPGMSGETLILKAHEISDKMRFIINTGSSEYEIPDELRRLGMESEHVFLKPLTDMDTVISTIEKLVAGKV